MKIVRYDNNDGVSITGTSLQGKIETTYDELVEIFGEPTYDAEDSGDGKVSAEWTIEFIVEIEGQYEIYEDCVTATIYDWKESSTPMGKHNWHIGGTDYSSVECVYQAIADNVAKKAVA